jgi:hypothetical protein
VNQGYTGSSNPSPTAYVESAGALNPSAGMQPNQAFDENPATITRGSKMNTQDPWDSDAMPF